MPERATAKFCGAGAKVSSTSLMVMVTVAMADPPLPSLTSTVREGLFVFVVKVPRQ